MVSKKDSERYNNLRIARTLDLLHYFGNEWVDLKSVKIEKLIKDWRGRTDIGFQPYLCLSCNEYWSLSLNWKKEKITDYLPKSTFNNIRCDKKTCEKCKNDNTKNKNKKIV